MAMYYVNIWKQNGCYVVYNFFQQNLSNYSTLAPDTSFSSVAFSVNLEMFNQVQFGQETAFGFTLDK